MILINVLRAFGYLFKLILCDCNPELRENNLEYYFKVKRQNLHDDHKKLDFERNQEYQQMKDQLIKNVDDLNVRF